VLSAKLQTEWSPLVLDPNKVAREVKDRSGGRDTTGLKKDEYGITASEGEQADEKRAD
jgi:hypothetical protein